MKRLFTIRNRAARFLNHSSLESQEEVDVHTIEQDRAFRSDPAKFFEGITSEVETHFGHHSSEEAVREIA